MNKMFCKNCGKTISDNARSCPKCGEVFSTPKTKKKSTAVLLAIFVGIFSWCYTWKKDQWKFWVNLVLIPCTLGMWAIVASIWVIIDQSCKSKEFFEDY